MIRSTLIAAAFLAFSAVTPALPVNAAQPLRDDSVDLTLDLTPIKEIVLDSGDYCPREPKALWCVGDGGSKNELTVAEVQAADVKLRAIYKEDVTPADERSGVYWRESTTGDCKTYALTLAARLHDAGESSRLMALMMSMPDPFEAHMTLLVETSDAGIVEVGDEEGGEPHKLDLNNWVRLGFSPLDGQRLWYLIPSQEEIALKFAMSPFDHIEVQPLPSEAKGPDAGAAKK